MRVAIFVDAGYLFAQGSTALTGSKVRRAELSLAARSVIEELKAFGAIKAPSASLLRIYWYDGVKAGTAMSADQAAIADLDDIKLRLGFINGQGQQKGVDSLIVTDLIELARQRAISEAVLLSGDEDVRVGVQIAQNYGVRIHLLGIAPARGSQSPTLRQEADTTFEWDRQTVEKFLSVRDESAVVAPAGRNEDAEFLIGDEAEVTDRNDPIVETVRAYVGTFQSADFSAIAAYWKDNRGVPAEFDGKLLARASERMGGRRLDRSEVQRIRALFHQLVEAALRR